MKIKAVVFDVGGVLEKSTIKSIKGHNDLGVHHFMAKRLDVGLDNWFDAIDTTYSSSMEGNMSEKEVLSIMARNLGVGAGKIESLFIVAYRKFFRKNKELYDYAFKLKKKGYKIAILSDQWPVSKKVLIREKEKRKFDFSIISCDDKLKKPDPKAYKYILKKLKVKPQETVFIDNREWNLKPARKLGLRVVLFKNNKQVFREMKKLGIKA